MLTRRAVLSVLACAPALSAASPANWGQFRGPGSRGVSEDDDRLPETWSATENVAWRTPLAGAAWSSPIVWGDRVFLTNVVSEGLVEPPKPGLYMGGNRLEPSKDIHRWSVVCLDLMSGEVVWEREVERSAPQTPRHLKNSYASETPVTDGERVYVHFGQIGTFCYSLAGELLWQKSWRPVQTRDAWGTASSPALHDGRLYIVNDNEDVSYLVALDKTTGEEIWRVERDEPSNWSTPYIWRNERGLEIVTTGQRKVRSYDLDGKLLWEISGMSSIVIPTPFSSHGLLYVASGYVGDETRPVFVVRPGARGDISLEEGTSSNASIAWSLPQGAPYNPSPLLYGKQRFRVGASAFTASPWAYNGKVFCLSEEGDCFVVEAGPEYKLVRENPIGEQCMATPAIAQGSLILRSAEAVYRITA